MFKKHSIIFSSALALALFAGSTPSVSADTNETNLEGVQNYQNIYVDNNINVPINESDLSGTETSAVEINNFLDINNILEEKEVYIEAEEIINDQSTNNIEIDAEANTEIDADINTEVNTEITTNNKKNVEVNTRETKKEFNVEAVSHSDKDKGGRKDDKDERSDKDKHSRQDRKDGKWDRDDQDERGDKDKHDRRDRDDKDKWNRDDKDKRDRHDRKDDKAERGDKDRHGRKDDKDERGDKDKHDRRDRDDKDKWNRDDKDKRDRDDKDKWNRDDKDKRDRHDRKDDKDERGDKDRHGRKDDKDERGDKDKHDRKDNKAERGDKDKHDRRDRDDKDKRDRHDRKDDKDKRGDKDKHDRKDDKDERGDKDKHDRRDRNDKDKWDHDDKDRHDRQDRKDDKSDKANSAVTTAPSQVVSQVNTNQKVLSLTFDDGNDLDTGHFEQILDILRDNDIKATFFLNGDTNPNLIKRVVNEGHLLGNHTFAHLGATDLTPKQLTANIKKQENLVRKLTGAELKPYYRPAYGDYNESVLETVGSLGYTKTIMWSVDPQDWSSIPAESIVNYVTSRIMPGGIYLLHANDIATGTPAALLDIIPMIKAQGYAFKTVADLLTYEGVFAEDKHDHKDKDKHDHKDKHEHHHDWDDEDWDDEDWDDEDEDDSDVEEPEVETPEVEKPEVITPVVATPQVYQPQYQETATTDTVLLPNTGAKTEVNKSGLLLALSGLGMMIGDKVYKRNRAKK